MIHIERHQAVIGFQVFLQSADFFFPYAGHTADVHIIRQVVNLNGNSEGIGSASSDVFLVVFFIR